MTAIKEIISKFDPISLEEADKVRLFNRTDTKFLFNIKHLPGLLEMVAEKYHVLEIKNERVLNYHTLYYDTPENKMYLAHHNGKMNRFKVRQREYLISGTTFIEIKFKNNKGRTIKRRMEQPEFDPKISDQVNQFITENTPFKGVDLLPRLDNSFSRISLIHKTISERITIDFGLEFRNGVDEATKLERLTIAEVKQEGFSIKSDFIQALRALRIQPTGMSKYCIGTAMTNKNIKSNRFKERILKINKIQS